MAPYYDWSIYSQTDAEDEATTDPTVSTTTTTASQAEQTALSTAPLATGCAGDGGGEDALSFAEWMTSPYTTVR